MLQALLATFAVSLIALVGIVFLAVERWSERFEMTLVSFAAGVLLSAAFLDLLPEAMTFGAGGRSVFAAALGAMIAFFLLERSLHGFHGHESGRAAASGYLILIGDGLHNFLDGVVIAASFMAGPAVGITTTLAVAAHEIPQELADYGILIRARFSPRQALALNFLSGLTAMVGAIVVFTAGAFVESHIAWFMTATAGMFIYIAASDLIPELHRSRLSGGWAQTVPFLVGVGLMALITSLIPH